MVQVVNDAYVFKFAGGRACLDFTNTLSRRHADPTERLLAYRDLAAWGRQADMLNDDEARRLTRIAAHHPQDAARTLSEAVALREALYRIFSAVIDGSASAEADVVILNGALSRALDHLRVVSRPRGFTWAWEAGDHLDRMLWPVLRSAADLLVSDDVHRVRRCAGETCAWLFLDASRNHSRRWCDMRHCGNRAKARRYYARKKASG
jgi:predicted RNA-binding Zn ribbon-like protein